MTIQAYQTLFESSITFGMRKQLQSEQGKSEIINRIEELEKQKENLKIQEEELKNKKSAILTKIEEKKTIIETKRKAELEFLAYQERHLKDYLNSIRQDSDNK